MILHYGDLTDATNLVSIISQVLVSRAFSSQTQNAPKARVPGCAAPVPPIPSR